MILSDASPALLERCHEVMGWHGWLDRARSVTAAAEDLAAVPDESVDVVTTRAVLIYVHDKRSVFASLHRVLRHGGRASMARPSPHPSDQRSRGLGDITRSRCGC